MACALSDLIEMSETARKRSDVVPAILEDGEPPAIAWVYTHRDDLEGAAVLDFGCGQYALYVQALRALCPGLNTIGYEWVPSYFDPSPRAQAFEYSVQQGLIDPNALDYQYDVVVASKVLNIQPSWECFDATMAQIEATMAPGALLVCSLEEIPRRLWSSGEEGLMELGNVLTQRFDRVVVASPVLLVCAGPKE